MRKYIFKGSAAALFLTVLVFAAQNGSSTRRAINPSSLEKSAKFSQGIQVGNTLYISGMQGTDKSGKLLNGIGAQTRGALADISAVLQAAGYSMNDLVQVNVFLSDINDFAAMNKVYVSVLPAPRPTRTTVQAGALVNGAKIEISAVAMKH